jgi:Flp pilus assembly protein TadB
VLKLLMRSPWFWGAVLAGVVALIAALGGYGYMMQRLGQGVMSAKVERMNRAAEQANRSTNSQIEKKWSERDPLLADKLRQEDSQWLEQSQQ